MAKANADQEDTGGTMQERMLKLQLKCEKMLNAKETNLRNIAMKQYKWFMQ